MFDIYINLLMVMIYIFEGLCMNCLSFDFNESRLKKYRVLRHSMGIIWALSEIIKYFAFVNPYGSYLLVELGIIIFIMILSSVLINKGSFLNRIFPAVTFIAIRELSVIASNCITGLGGTITKPVYYLTVNGIIPADCFSVVNNIVYPVFLTFIGAVRIFIIYFIIKKIVKYHRYGQDIKSNIRICIIPALAGIVTTALIKLIIVTFENGYTVIIYSRYPLLYLIIPVLSVTLLLSVVMTFKQCQDMTGLQIENTEKMVLENQMTQMQNSLSETEQLYDNMRSVRHDIKNNMAVIQSLIEKKCSDDEEIKQYFDEMLISAELLERRVNTGNAVSDCIISGKFAYAEKIIPDIKLESEEFVFNSSCGIKAYDVGMILNNGIDNAVEACLNMRRSNLEKDSFIKIRSFRKRNMFFIEIENSFEGCLKIDDVSGLPLSTKENPEFHGIGMRNIKKCAEKYSGGIDYSANENKFTLTVMMKEEKYVDESK